MQKKRPLDRVCSMFLAQLKRLFKIHNTRNAHLYFKNKNKNIFFDFISNCFTYEQYSVDIYIFRKVELISMDLIEVQR